MKLLLAFALVLSSLAPVAAAQEPRCVEQLHFCVGLAPCQGPSCMPVDCEPVARCEGQAGDPRRAGECAVNMTIDGQTCHTGTRLALRHGGARAGNEQLVAPARASIAVTTTDGNVNRHNLVNSWTTPEVWLDVAALGQEPGELSAGLYHSTIYTEGPRSGLHGQLSPGHQQEWQQYSIVLRHRNTSGEPEDVQVSVWLLDKMPNGCHVRSPSGAAPEVDCPRFYELLP